METVFAWIGACVVPVCTALMGLLTYKIQRKDKKQDEMDQHIKSISRNMDAIEELTKSVVALTEETGRQGCGMRILLRSSLHDDHKALMKQGYVTSNQLRDFQEAYNVYHQEGGNGTATRWLKDIMNLPIRDELPQQVSFERTEVRV